MTLLGTNFTGATAVLFGSHPSPISTDGTVEYESVAISRRPACNAEGHPTSPRAETRPRDPPGDRRQLDPDQRAAFRVQRRPEPRLPGGRHRPADPDNGWRAQGGIAFAGNAGPVTMTNAQLAALLGAETDFKLRAALLEKGLLKGSA